MKISLVLVLCNTDILCNGLDTKAINQYYASIKPRNLELPVNQKFTHSFIHSGHFYSASSSPLLLRSAPDTAWILCRSFTLQHHRQLRVKDLPKVPMWRLERDSKTRPSSRKASTLPMRHHIPKVDRS